MVFQSGSWFRNRFRNPLFFVGKLLPPLRVLRYDILHAFPCFGEATLRGRVLQKHSKIFPVPDIHGSQEHDHFLRYEDSLISHRQPPKPTFECRKHIEDLHPFVRRFHPIFESPLRCLGGIFNGERGP